MNDFDALCEAVRRAPQDDALKLILADWCEMQDREPEAILAKGLRWCVANNKRPDVVDDKTGRCRWLTEAFDWYLFGTSLCLKSSCLPNVMFSEVMTRKGLRQTLYLDVIEAYTAVGMALLELQTKSE